MIIKKGKRCEIWFNEETNQVKNKYKIVEYNNMYFLNKDSFELRKTLLNDLTENNEQLFNRFSKSTKYEIRKADLNGILFHIECEKINNDTIIDFINCYSEFMEKKGLKTLSKKTMYEKLNLYYRHGMLAISYAVMNKKRIAFTVHIFDKKYTRLLFATPGILEIGEKKQFGYANKGLHYYVMKYFREVGVNYYDWGGISNLKELSGVTKFKESFGGYEVNTYFGKTYKFPYNIINNILKIFIKKRNLK